MFLFISIHRLNLVSIEVNEMKDWKKQYNKNWEKGSWEGVVHSSVQYHDEKCVYCGKQYNDIHHVKKVNGGWKEQNVWGNVVPVCKSCHHKIHNGWKP
jgi:benzoyl-CoA reductase/2-hydroxyglutaryl-CoA dehydratase subunit BcrC/BadD/HgdB